MNELEQACVDLYMDLHISEVKKESDPIKVLWLMGRGLWEKRERERITLEQLNRSA